MHQNSHGEQAPSPPARIVDLTCCRAFFALWVYLYHIDLQLRPGMPFGPFERLVRRGYLGVDGFFVLSGAVLALAHPQLLLLWPQLRQFWAKRLRRIYPVHFAMIFLLGALLGGGLLAGIHPRHPERFGLGELLRHLLLVHGWGASDRWAWNYPSWSISTEWAGYLAFPMLWLVMRWMPCAIVAIITWIMLAFLLLVDLRAGLVGLNLTYEGALGRFFPEFVAGMALIRLSEAIRVSGRMLTALGVGIAVAAGFLWRDTLVVVGLWLLMAGLVCAAREGRKPLFAWVPGLTWLGVVSYAYYMSFAPVEMSKPRCGGSSQSCPQTCHCSTPRQRLR